MLSNNQYLLIFSKIYYIKKSGIKKYSLTFKLYKFFMNLIYLVEISNSIDRWTKFNVYKKLFNRISMSIFTLKSKWISTHI